MGWFSDVTNFLSSPGFRIGAGIAGAAAGAGAFDSLGDFGTALTYGAGAANTLAGVASTFGPDRSPFERASGILQAGLGGYNLLQNQTDLPFGLGSVGGFGNFGQVYDRLFGTAGASADTTGGILPFDEDYPGVVSQRSPQQTSMLPFSESGDPSAGGRIGASGTTIPPTDPLGNPQPTMDPNAALPPVGTADNPQPGVEMLPVEGRPATAEEQQRLVRRSITGAALPRMPGTPPNAGGLDATLPSSAPMDAAAAAPLAIAAAPDMAGGAVAGGLRIGQDTVRGFLPNGQALVVRNGQLVAVPVPGVGSSTGGFMDRLLDSVSRNPMSSAMSALQIGGMLVSMFSQSQSSVVNNALQDAMSRIDPSSPNGEEFQRLYQEKARTEIERQYNEIRSALEAKMAGRGMLRSTVYTSGLDQLERSRVELLANLPYNALVAWNQVAQTQAAGLRGAAAYAQVQAAAQPRLDFSNMTRVLAQSPLVQNMAR